MSDTTAPEEPARAETIPVTINVPAGLLAGYDAEVERGLYETREIALLHGLVESRTHHKAATATCGWTFGGRTTRGRIRRPTMTASRTRSPRPILCGMRERASLTPACRASTSMFGEAMRRS